MSATVARKAGSVAGTVVLLMTRTNSSCGVPPPDALNVVSAMPDSVVPPEAWVPWMVFVPPIATLVANRPMVKTNQSTKTGQRWRALQVATRTVSGLPEAPVSLVADIR